MANLNTVYSEGTGSTREIRAGRIGWVVEITSQWTGTRNHQILSVSFEDVAKRNIPCKYDEPEKYSKVAERLEWEIDRAIEFYKYKTRKAGTIIQ